jgi:hypothetical protein
VSWPETTPTLLHLHHRTCVLVQLEFSRLLHPTCHRLFAGQGGSFHDQAVGEIVQMLTEEKFKNKMVGRRHTSPPAQGLQRIHKTKPNPACAGRHPRGIRGPGKCGLGQCA